MMKEAKMKKTLMMILMAVFLVGFVFSDLLLVYAEEKGGEEFTLEEITVTAEKREENQQKVPIAMEVVSGDEIKEIGKNDINEILDNISSVLIQSNTDGIRVSIRGVSNDNSPFSGISVYTPSVAVNQDSVYTNRNQGNQNMYDIERVEVLFGPQSTLYASASPGGIVNVITSNPKLAAYEAAGTLEYGNYNLLHTEGSMNAPLGEKVAVRAAFSTSVHDGYLTNGAMDEDKKSARLKALFQPNEKLTFLLIGEVNTTGGQGFASVAQFINQDDKDNPWTSSQASAGKQNNEKIKKTSARMDWDMGNVGTLSVIASYLKNSSSFKGVAPGMAPPGMVAPDYDTDEVSRGTEKDIEARMVSSADFPFKWILGVNIYRSVNLRESDMVGVDNPADIRYDYFDSFDEMEAIFGNITYPITDSFRATAGARKSHHINGTTSHSIPGRGPGEAEFYRKDKTLFDDPIYRLGFEYDLADTSMLYADWSSSYRMNGATTNLSPVETLYAYTSGIKNRFLNNRLQLNVSAYYYDYKNYFANLPPLFVAYDSDNNGTFDNRYEVDGKTYGDARVYGLDVQTSTIITAQDKLDLSVSYIKKYFTDLAHDWPDVVNDLGLPDLDYNGKDMPQAPNWNVAANYSHSFFLANGGSLKASIDIRYTTETCLNFQAEILSLNYEQDALGNYTGNYTTSMVNTSDARWQEAYHIENVNLVYSDPDGKWTLSGYVNNLGNYAVKQFLDGNGNLMIGNPRTYGAVLSVKF